MASKDASAGIRRSTEAARLHGLPNTFTGSFCLSERCCLERAAVRGLDSQGTGARKAAICCSTVSTHTCVGQMGSNRVQPVPYIRVPLRVHRITDNYIKYLRDAPSSMHAAS